jgi:release factor glutamine methyltransferase
MIALERQLWRTALAWRFRLFQRHRYQRLVLEHLEHSDIAVVVLPHVFNPKLLRTGEFFADFLSRAANITDAARVLDLGTGSGVAAIAAAKRGAQVTAIDINPAAVRCTRINALLNNLETHIDILHGDLFDPVPDERFDLILFNPPYYRGTPRDALDHAWRAPDLIERFAAQLAAHLAPNGTALLVLSTDGERDAFLDALHGSQFDTTLRASRDFGNEVVSIYQVTRS